MEQISKTRIGWREWVAFPEFDNARVKAKVDTGAKTSSIHAHGIRELLDVDAPTVSFFLRPNPQEKHNEILCTALISDKRIIRSSNGDEEERFVIRTKLGLDAKVWPIEMTLANRDGMEHRVLIGRDAIKGKFLIDPSASFLLGDV